MQNAVENSDSSVKSSHFLLLWVSSVQRKRPVMVTMNKA